MLVKNSVIPTQGVPRRTCHISEERSFRLIYIDITDIRNYGDNDKIVSKNENGYTSTDRNIHIKTQRNLSFL
jgi:hypothetical protein